MRIGFTVDISSLDLFGASSQDGRIDRGRLVDLAWAAESAGIDRLLITDNDGTQDAASIASYFLHATATLGVEIEHRVDLLPPEVAARQIATLDQLSAGRTAVRFKPLDDAAVSHEEKLARLDEYVMLIKRLWANDKPIDYEGRFFRLKAAFSGAKPFAAASVPLALAGVSGTAVNVAARHCDSFVLPPSNIEETRQTIERVREAIACHRRADAVRFALPVRFLGGARARTHGFWPVEGWAGYGHKTPRTEVGSFKTFDAVQIDSPEKFALEISSYGAVGVTDFILGGLRTVHDVTAFGGMIASLKPEASSDRRVGSGTRAGSPARTLLAG